MRSRFSGLRLIPYSNRLGVTLTELMIALAIMSVGVAGGMASFQYITKAIAASRTKTIATNMAQEKMELLKNKSYYQLLVTTYTASSTGYSPNFTYDAGNYPPEIFTLWGAIPLTRAVRVDYVSVAGGTVTVLPANSNDPGMKKITIYVYWTERNIQKKIEIDSYYENPNVAAMSTGFKGQVCLGPATAPCSAPNVVAGALVQVAGIPKWRGYADSGGNYSFSVAPGSYSLVCSSPGFTTQNTGMLSVVDGLSTSQDFSLPAIATGTISASSLYTYDPSLVISQVVASTTQADGFDIQYVELFNPTTSAINIGSSVASHSIKLNVISVSGNGGNPRTCLDVNLIYTSTYVASGRYYLIANRSSFTVLGTNYTADAYYTDTANTACSVAPPDWSAPSIKRIIQASYNDSIWLTDSAGNQLDAVGWKHGGAIPSPCGTSCIPMQAGSHGLLPTDQVVRFSTACAPGNTYGRAFQTNDNPNNFYYNNAGSAAGLIYSPFSSANGAQLIVSGTPSTGAYVFANDGYSSGIQSSNSSVTGAQGQTCLYSSFTLVGVATGTWSVTAMSGNLDQVVSNVAVTQGNNTSITNSVTSPLWPASNLNYIAIASTYTGGLAVGYVYGAGPSYSTPLSPIAVGAAGFQTTTNAQGFYLLSLSTGTNTVTANLNSANGNYQTSSVDVTINQGAAANVPDFHLGAGGYITGYVTSGSGALPNIPVDATQGGSTYSDTTDSTGHFSIFVTTTASAYAITPALDSSESYSSVATSPCAGSPISCTVTVAGSTVFGGTITVTGAMGTITGTVKNNGSIITTGVLIVASTATVPDPPADVVASSAPALAPFYSGSSQSDGTYSLDVRGSATATYNVRAFYPVVDINSGSVSYTSKYLTGISVTAGATLPNQNFTWP